MSTSEDNGKDTRDARTSKKSSDGDAARSTAKGKSASAANEASGKAEPKGKTKGLKIDEPDSRRKRNKGTKPVKIEGANPSWWAPVMLGLMVVGLLWIVVFYLTSGDYPVPGISYWNLAIGFGAIMSGFMMTTRWR